MFFNNALAVCRGSAPFTLISLGPPSGPKGHFVHLRRSQGGISKPVRDDVGGESGVAGFLVELVEDGAQG